MNYSPYAPPRHDPYGGGGGYYAQHVYKPLGWKTTVAIIGMVGTVILSSAQTAATVAFPGVMKNPVPENLGIILVLGLLGLLTGGVAIGTYVVFLLWMHQAAKNVRAFGQQGLEHTPGWCVGWWFIPFASLWKPFTAMREIWKASDPETVGPRAAMDWRAAPVPPTMPAWWAVYVVNGFIGIVIAVSNLDWSGPTPVATVTPLNFITHALLGVAGVLLIMIMRQLARRQEAAAERLAGASASPPGGHDQANPYAAQASASNPYA
jgi:hypothetical protein